MSTLSISEHAFPGTYAPNEVSFLMRRLHLSMTPLEERERLIQSGQRHYSEMIGGEDAPNRERLRLFRQCLATNGNRMAADIATLAAAMASSITSGELTVVSIARAGTPVGVLLWHRLRLIAPQLKLAHYSISVIRDRGLDFAALNHILSVHSAESIRFVDGWTGKGTIAEELRQSLAEWDKTPPSLDAGLWVPLDVCGAAAFAASARDYLIPSTLLGGTISGLISRSVLPRDAAEMYHGCMLLDHLRRYDLSRWFIREMNARLAHLPLHLAPPPNQSGGTARRIDTEHCLDAMLARHRMTDRNRIKLGIGETVRVLLRRMPQIIWLSPSANEADAAFIRRLAAMRSVPVETDESLPFDAIAIIAEASPRPL